MDQNSSIPKSSCVKATLDRIWDLDFKSKVPTPDYPPISSIPRTSPDRLQRATPKGPPADHIPSSSPSANDYLYDHTASVPTVLYLAYGSNLCAQTFLGQRGIRPVSAVNVSAPTLRLTFDLPGIPYKEPCFANTAIRKVPKHPPIPDPPGKVPDLPRPPPFTFPPTSEEAEFVSHSDEVSTPHRIGLRRDFRENAYGDPEWDKGLIGVVYEVTPEDYATIIKTEGGGTSYQDILVPCIAIPNKVGIPEDPPIPELPKPFFAHTLFAPRVPKKPGDGDGDDGDEDKKGARRTRDGGDDDDGDGEDKSPLDRLKDWWQDMLLRPIRPDPEYAQPSARYLKLITDGAAEHGLPDEYQEWLAKLQPYTITSRRQTIGQYLFLVLALPIMGLFLGLSKWLADDRGKVPLWLSLFMETLFHVVWLGYDRVFQPLFGDGERTEDEDEKRRHRGSRRMLRSLDAIKDEEKLELMGR